MSDYLAGIQGVPGSIAYASSKAAIRNHTKSVAAYCAQQGYPIRCNSVHPGPIETEIWNPLFRNNEQIKQAVLSKLKQGIPLKRLGTAEEVAKSILFLASDDASYVTGAELIVDGGALSTWLAD